jgi:formylglycine-generating enzyme required for sulfatase activity
VAILEGRHGRWVEPLWRELAGGAQPEGRLRAAMALAAYDPPAGAAARWHEHAAFVAEQMLAEARQDPSQYEPLVAAFTPAAGVLAAPLTEFFYNAARDAKGELAASVLARYASNEPATLAELVADAQDVQFKALYPVLAERFAGPARGTLERIVREGPPAALPADQRVRLGRRRAALAAVLARQGRRDEAFDALRVGDDPESRTQFIHRSREMGVTAAELDDCVNRADELRQSKTGDERRIDDGVLYGLLLALGEYELSDLPAERRDPMVQQLADWYAHDPSSAVHGAAGWLLWRWNQVDYVMKVDQTPLAYSPDREWFVVEFAPQVVEQKQEADGAKSAGPTEDQQGADAPRAQPPAVSPPFYITFVVFPAGEYLIGSPPDESDHIANEVLHRVRLTRAFALSDREITWEQFTPFGVWHHDRWQEQFHHELGVDDPAFGMTWYEGAAFCRWLGECAQMSGLEQAYADPKSLDPKEYPPDPDPNAGGAPRDWPVEPSKHGFRLPSNAEWEAACRCGTLSAYSFGNDRELLAHYAWNADNSALFFEDRQKWSHRVGRLRPNARGLFDMHGNLFEWCHDWYGDYAEGEDLIGTKTGVSRVRRGGAFPDVAANCRSAYRDGYQPTSRWAFLGLRVLLVPK